MSIDLQLLIKQASQAYESRQFQQAQMLAEQILAFNDELPEIWVILGRCLEEQQLYQAAIIAYQRYLKQKGPAADIYSKIGVCYRRLDDLSESLAFHKLALDQKPNSSNFWLNYAIAQREAGLYRESLASFTKSLEYNPNNVTAIFGQAIIHLALGEYKTGFHLLESRSIVFPNSYRNRDAFPQWKGEVLGDKYLIILAEQGFGDTILFTRFIPLIKQFYSVKILLVLPQDLYPVFKQLDGADLVIGTQMPVQKSQCAAEINIMSLPQFLNIGPIESLPPPPLLHIPLEATQKIAPLIQAYQHRFKIGIVWTGRESNQYNALRSIPLIKFLELQQLPGIELFGFCKGAAEADIQKEGLGGMIHNLGSHFENFADTAAAINAMDLIISIDSSVAHLAGTLNKRTWLLLHTSPYWVWLEGRKDSPWYPSLRLYRQQERGNWEAVFDEVLKDLRELLAPSPQKLRRRIIKND